MTGLYFWGKTETTSLPRWWAFMRVEVSSLRLAMLLFKGLSFVLFSHHFRDTQNYGFGTRSFSADKATVASL